MKQNISSQKVAVGYDFDKSVCAVQLSESTYDCAIVCVMIDAGAMMGGSCGGSLFIDDCTGGRQLTQ